MKWELGLSTGIGYQHPIDQVLEPIGRVGFRAIEISTARRHLDLAHTKKLEELAQRIAELGLRVHALHAPFGHDVDFTDPDSGFRRRSLEHLIRAADALQVLGGGLYVIHPGGEDHNWVWERESRLARSVEGLTKAWELCRQRELTLVVETPLPHLLGGQLEDLAWLLNRIPMEGTGVCLDTSHTSLGGLLFEAIERFAGRLIHVQASDNRGVTDDHLPPGEGVIDWARVVSTLERVSYRGVFMLEVAGDGDVLAHVQSVAARARQTFSESWGGRP